MHPTKYVVCLNMKRHVTHNPKAPIINYKENKFTKMYEEFLVSYKVAMTEEVQIVDHNSLKMEKKKSNSLTDREGGVSGWVVYEIMFEDSFIHYGHARSRVPFISGSFRLTTPIFQIYPLVSIES